MRIHSQELVFCYLYNVFSFYRLTNCIIVYYFLLYRCRFYPLILHSKAYELPLWYCLGETCSKMQKLDRFSRTWDLSFYVTCLPVFFGRTNTKLYVVFVFFGSFIRIHYSIEKRICGDWMPINDDNYKRQIQMLIDWNETSCEYLGVLTLPFRNSSWILEKKRKPV